MGNESYSCIVELDVLVLCGTAHASMEKEASSLTVGDSMAECDQRDVHASNIGLRIVDLNEVLVNLVIILAIRTSHKMVQISAAREVLLLCVS